MHSCTIEAVRGLGSLRGVAMPWADIVGLAGVFATALGIRALEDEESAIR